MANDILRGEMNNQIPLSLSTFGKWRAYFEKYRALLLSILIFIVLDLSILLFNFYISHQIANNAAVINVAAKQEVLSQKISKNLLVFERAYNKSIPYDGILDEIEQSIMAFDQSLAAFDRGGELGQGDNRLTIAPVTDTVGRQAIEEAKPIWLIYKNYTNSILEEFRNQSAAEESLVTIFSREYLIKSVVGYTARNNVNLLNVMERLTKSVETSATQKTRQLRVIQLFGIFLAVVNFFYIMFYSLKKIQRKDQALHDAKKEVEVMLNAITEGVVLIDSDLVIREHYSTEMEKIFNRADFVGKPIVEILRDANCEEDADVIESYIRQWFNMAQDVKNLIKHNPIAKVHIYNSGQAQFYSGEKYLTIGFSRIYQQQGGVEFLLVRFKDVTESVEQNRAVNSERASQHKQFQLMSSLLNTDTDDLPYFFYRGFECIKEIRQLVAHQRGEVVGLSELIPQKLQLFKQQCQSHGFDELINKIERLEKGVRDSAINNEELITTERKWLPLLDDVHNELESIYELTSNLLGERLVKQADQIVPSNL